MDLLELADRVEKLVGPDREVDAAIGAAMHALGWHAADCLGSYTVSLDAAMSLVPEGWNFEVDRVSGRGGGAVVNQSVLSRHAITADAATPALALTAAALRARASVAGDRS